MCFFFGCQQHESKINYQFYYYPEKNVYYDPIKKNFLYTLNGAKTWNVFTNPNTTEPTYLGKKVVINTADTVIYHENEGHRKLYAGKLFAITNDDSTVGKAVGSPEAVERAVVTKRKTTVVRKRGTAKPKNSIGKFIDKIFGKN